MGLGADGLMGGAYDDAIFCNAAGITVEVVGSVVAAETSLDGGIEGGGIITIDDGIPLLMTFWEAAEIGVELSKGCLNEPNGVLAAAAAAVVVMFDGGKVMLLDESGAFCSAWLSVVTTDGGFGNEERSSVLAAVGSGALLVVSKLGRLPPIENGGKEKDTGFLSKEKVLAKVEDGANVSLAKILLTRGVPVTVVIAGLTVVKATVVVVEMRTFGCKT